MSDKVGSASGPELCEAGPSMDSHTMGGARGLWRLRNAATCTSCPSLRIWASPGARAEFYVRGSKSPGGPGIHQGLGLAHDQRVRGTGQPGTSFMFSLFLSLFQGSKPGTTMCKASAVAPNCIPSVSLVPATLFSSGSLSFPQMRCLPSTRWAGFGLEGAWPGGDRQGKAGLRAFVQGPTSISGLGWPQSQLHFRAREGAWT